ncbi:sialidase-like protein [Grosmannia clavigera kw1407]|uniref:Sialidase-like protein n=1 Tax=Grosmannia clavigera (strain kw1407 / UAMH 11150) TaxID=655863 RepID=F0XUZ0_GROCL|nr:sialidase-like protein [Grosmannia clavigera kw1407]EFW98571.1 sialidase-like protein [Grosmannia clavigera kw1407]
MSTLAADLAFDFTFPSGEPATPPTTSYSYDPNLLDVPYQHHPNHGLIGGRHGDYRGHSRSASQCSAYSAYSFASSTPSESFLSVAGSFNTAPSTRNSTPARSPIRTHGPLLLPKIRSRDQALGSDDAYANAYSPPKRAKTSPAPQAVPRGRSTAAVHRRRPTYPVVARHVCSFTSPDPGMFPSRSFSEHNTSPERAVSRPLSSFESTPPPPTLLCSSVDFVLKHDGSLTIDPGRRASYCNLDDGSRNDDQAKFEYGFAPYPGTVPSATISDMTAVPTDSTEDAYLYQHHRYGSRALSPFSVESISVEATPEPMLPPAVAAAAPVAGPSSSLLNYLTAPNPAPALVRTISFPLRDPSTKHFWWDIRQVRSWSAFSATGLLSLPGATAVLSCPVPVSFLPPQQTATCQHPETEIELQSICAGHYLPRVNFSLTLSSPRPIQLAMAGDVFVGRTAGDASSATALFGGKPTARVVGLVKSYDRFNTGMRVEGNVKKVEYLRGLAHLHHLMREHSCRYGFILTEIELVVVRNGTEMTPLFGQVEVASVPLATTVESPEIGSTPLTACMALWGLCMLASDEMAAAAAATARSDSDEGSLLCSHHTHIGAPAEGTRRKAAPRDSWMPPPQLAEKRTAKRARGWVMPEDAVGRKEMGRRGVRYGGPQ